MDISATIQAKSNQLNALEIAGDMIILVTDVQVVRGDQPVSINYQGDNGKPWKPSLGMRRILAQAWGNESSQWIGRMAKVYCDPTVTWAGEQVGGIRIRALSHISKDGIKTAITLNKKKRIPFFVEYLDPPVATMYPQDQFDANLPNMKAALAGDWTLEQVIAECEKVGKLTDSQIEQLKAP